LLDLNHDLASAVFQVDLMESSQSQVWFTAGLWSQYSDFRLRLQLRASNFIGSGVKRNFWPLRNFWPVIVFQLSCLSEQTKSGNYFFMCVV